ncbi:hypothetical protein MPTK1_5g24210 [Marchantia polymorpha subsp. ruderalis]|uniref:Uncharacterized protein n=2 Tax=Marchantia polymorpha TaxID=3197 RepID=A0A176VH10_MARPO|nr:hypothetical protein AXG93_1219s1090 [Marchantia polymorpha subsp. ruderalis]PTQ46624.1 hypothetical protein MARPO_0010s0035 [Marchantia polymorpha]BBN12946.1 hypothetical protein Mp_5g24210 [Marchantia polymorpha subsp. ruderalis]|eukprot:PTQ46624.1 hypothetical protein MARPO_0010s0035 [Marchantia polymorpha]
MTTIMSPLESPWRAQKPFMSTGDGVDSYARNSHPQGDFMSRLIPTLFDVIDSLNLPDQGVISVADLGCSSGPNAIKNVDAIINRMKARFGRTEGPEFQAYFQDLPGTDFNTLFRLLDPDQKAETSPGGQVEDAAYFTAGVPGSFYGRLFPRASINFAMSTFALHWISKVPAAVVDKKSPAYNGGHTQLGCSSLATVDAYAEQSHRDLSSFLTARAVEMVSGGSMLLVFGLRGNYYPYRVGPTLEVQDKIWNDLVLEGIVDSELRDSHNNYVYYRTLNEVDKVLSNFTSLFKVQKRDVYPSPLSSSFFLYPASTAEEKAQRITSVMKGAVGNLIKAHFGAQNTNIFMQRYKQALIEGFTNKTLVEDLANARKHLVLVLCRI